METARPILCLGEAIVDLICEKPLPAGQAPDRLVPYPGGALANVAVAAARAGAPAALAGGVGTDQWGDWLARLLEEEGVSTDWLARLEHADTPLGIVTLDAHGEPTFQIYGEHIGPTMAAAGEHLAEAVASSSGLVIGSNTMVGTVEREVTRRAVELSVALDRPVLFDPNFRPNRWRDRSQAVTWCRELVRGSRVVKCNRFEAELLTGESDALAAARLLVADGPGLAVVTDGDRNVVTAGAVEAAWRPVPAEVVSPLGAGDAFMGAFAAGLLELDWDLERAGETLERSARAAAEVCAHLGAQG